MTPSSKKQFMLKKSIEHKTYTTPYHIMALNAKY